ncbi:MAG: class I SAM-dependent rRNA methyltransferase [Bdellovibrionales bacterium]|nr:class I SAM-dependent rRNA methyltransferase [Bdellovibrionales bacterium]
MLKVKLSRDLRRDILRGHPWIYRQSIEGFSSPKQASLVQVLDRKGQPLAWGFYDPHSPLALRILSLEKKPPNFKFFEQKFLAALYLRSAVTNDQTNSFRLFNGEGDFLPGLVCDIYHQVAVLQFDGLGPFEFWDQGQIVDWLLKNTRCKTVVIKSQSREDRAFASYGEELTHVEVEILENGLRFLVNLEKGQKTGFFLDQRENRLYLKSFCKKKRVLNLFSYTGGFSMYAGSGGATHVDSVDLSSPAIEFCERNWVLNSLPPQMHEGHAMDVFEFLEMAKDQWDVVIVDPPSMGSSEKNKDKAVNAYVDAFQKAARKVGPGGSLVLSSCSSHISFSDFFEIIDQSLSSARRKGQILRVSGQGADHPFPHACHELRYLKFVHLVLD